MGVFNLIKTIIGPSVMTIISIISIIIEKNCDFNERDINKKKKERIPQFRNFS
jgi:hypothetical protein